MLKTVFCQLYSHDSNDSTGHPEQTYRAFVSELVVQRVRKVCEVRNNKNDINKQLDNLFMILPEAVKNSFAFDTHSCQPIAIFHVVNIIDIIIAANVHRDFVNLENDKTI